MRKTIVLTLQGRDRAGLLERVAEVVAGHGGSFTETRMVALGGRLVGLQLVSIAEARLPDFRAALAALGSGEEDFSVTASDGLAAAADPAQYLRLELLGHDRPGIVHEVTRLLAYHGVSVEEFETRCVSGSFSGGEMFQASGRLRLPAGLGAERLRGLLSALAQEMMVDINLEEPLP